MSNARPRGCAAILKAIRRNTAMPANSTRSGARTAYRAAGELRAMGVPDGEIATIDEVARWRVDEAVAVARAGMAPAPEAALADVYSPKSSRAPARADAAA